MASAGPADPARPPGLPEDPKEGFFVGLSLLRRWFEQKDFSNWEKPLWIAFGFSALLFYGLYSSASDDYAAHRLVLSRDWPLYSVVAVLPVLFGYPAFSLRRKRKGYVDSLEPALILTPETAAEYEQVAKHYQWHADEFAKRSGPRGCAVMLGGFFGLCCVLAIPSLLVDHHYFAFICTSLMALFLILWAIYFSRRTQVIEKRGTFYRDLAEKALDSMRRMKATEARERDVQYEAKKRQEEEEVRQSGTEFGGFELLSDEERTQHVWLTGGSGQGKSTFMQMLAVHDMAQGLPEANLETKTFGPIVSTKKGVTVIDPAGELVARILEFVPFPRYPETIYFDIRNPVPIDFLSWETPAEKRTVVANIISLFHTFSERTGAQVGKVMEDILYPLLYTLLDARDVSFLDIYHFLKDQARREEILRQPSILPEYRAHWKKTPLNIQEISPITRLLSPLVHDPILRIVFGCRHGRSPDPPHEILKMSDIVLNKKILLVNLSGTDPSDPSPKIVGSLIIQKLMQASFSQPPPESDRIFHMLYMDEFPNYQMSADFTAMLSQARKFRLCMMLANQWFDQITDEIFSGLLTVQNWYLFQLQFQDANRFRQAGLQTEAREFYDSLKEDLGVKRPSNVPKHMFRGIRTVVKPFDVLELTRLEKFHAVHRKATDLIRRVAIPDWRMFADAKAEVEAAKGKPMAYYTDRLKRRTLETYSCRAAPERHTQKEDADSAEITSERRKPPQ